MNNNYDEKYFVVTLKSTSGLDFSDKLLIMETVNKALNEVKISVSVKDITFTDNPLSFINNNTTIMRERKW